MGAGQVEDIAIIRKQIQSQQISIRVRYSIRFVRIRLSSQLRRKIGKIQEVDNCCKNITKLILKKAMRNSN